MIQPSNISIIAEVKNDSLLALGAIPAEVAETWNMYNTSDIWKESSRCYHNCNICCGLTEFLRSVQRVKIALPKMPAGSICLSIVSSMKTEGRHECLDSFGIQGL